MIENLQNEHKQAKGAKPCVNIRSWRAKNSPKHSSKYYKSTFDAKNVFFLLICLHLHLASHQEADIYGEKNLTRLTLTIFLILDFITCS